MQWCVSEVITDGMSADKRTSSESSNVKRQGWVSQMHVYHRAKMSVFTTLSNKKGRTNLPVVWLITQVSMSIIHSIQTVNFIQGNSHYLYIFNGAKILLWLFLLLLLQVLLELLLLLFLLFWDDDYKWTSILEKIILKSVEIEYCLSTLKLSL